MVTFQNGRARDFVDLPPSPTAGHRLRRTAMPYCPKCGRKFHSEFQVTRHLGQPFSLCAKVERILPTKVRWSRSTRYSPGPKDDQLQDVQAHDEDDHPVPEDSFGPENGDVLTPNPSEIPIDGSLPQTHPFFREEFIGAAETYGRGSTFMDDFDADAHTRNRQGNVFYPFASRQDWELVLFLLSSGMSMARIDQFLGLELVRSVLGYVIL